MHPFAGSLLLVVAVAGVVAGVRVLLSRCGETRASVVAASTAAVVAAVPLTLQPLTGIVAAVLLLGGAGVLAATLARSATTTTTTTTTSPLWSPAARVIAALLFGLLAITALGAFLWDEASTHLPLAGAISRDLVPLQHPLFPGQPLRYHAGFDVVTAIVRAFTVLPLDTCIDVVTIGGIVLMLWGIHDLASAVRPGSGALAMPVVLLAGGPVAALLADGWGMALPGKDWLPSAWVNGAVFPPLVVTNVFQHPQGLAMPIACAALMVASPQAAARTQTRRFLVAALLIVLCSRVQIVFAAFAGLGLLVLALRGRDLTALAVLVVAAGVCAADSGFTQGAAQLLWGGAFPDDGAAGTARVLLSFGLSLGAPIFGLLLWRRQRNELVLALAVVGSVGFVVGNLVSYARSWDIVKFFGVSAFFSHFLMAACLAQVRRGWAIAVVFVVGLLTCWSGTLWLLRHGIGNGVIAGAYRERGQGDDIAAFADAVAPFIPAAARVFSPDLGLARAGVLVPGTDWRSSRDTAALLIDRGQTEVLTKAWRDAKRSLSDEALRTLEAEYVVVRANDPAAGRAKDSALLTLLADPTRFETVPVSSCGWLLFRIRRGGT